MPLGPVTARGVLGLGLAGLAWGCAAAPPAVRPQPVPREVAQFLLDPATGSDSSAGARISALHRRLLGGESEAALRPEIEAVPWATDDGANRTLLLAQLAFREGRRQEARDHLARLGPGRSSSTAARLLDARTLELEGAVVEAYLGYAELAAEDTVAATRAKELVEEVAGRLLERIRAALAARQLQEAIESLEILERIDSEDEATLELAVAVAGASGDAARELAAVRALAAAQPGRRELQLRRGELEVEVGDATAGLELLEGLAANPADSKARAVLESARFSYRLANLPEDVRQTARRPELSRADFARLIYWLVPRVRSTRPDATRIATDVLDHPAREEIVRVANLGLMQIDEALHRFDPERAVTRDEAFRALARLAGEDARGSASCGFAIRAHWVAEAGDCLGGATVTGDQAVGWMRSLAVSAAAREVEQ